MSKPIVAVVGRPNVGKSTLFNSLCGQQISIVKDTPGVTRDRIYAEVSWLNHNFTLIDTGGIEPDTGDIILSQMREQAEIAIETADVIIFMTDVKQGLVDSDSKVADMLRRSHKPVILVVNKVDSFEKMMPDVYEFYNLGIGDPVPVSAASRLGIGDMLDAVIAHFPEHEAEEKEDERPRVAIVGKPNVGKSSLINRLLGEQRVIVSDIAGTTRDAIDTDIYRVIDYLANVINDVDDAEKRIADAEKMIANCKDPAEQKNLEAYKESLETEKSLRVTVMTEAFGKGLSMVDKAQEKLNVAVADLGTRYSRVKLTYDKLSDQKVDVEEQLSNNEDVDISDAYINMTQADNLYQYALTATSKILGNTLLDYI